MFYVLCYELIKSVLLLIVLHYLFLYLKNLCIEVYEFNPVEVSLNKYIKPLYKDYREEYNIENKNNNDVYSPAEKPIVNAENYSNHDGINKDDVNKDDTNNNITDHENNIKDELVDFINNELYKNETEPHYTA